MMDDVELNNGKVPKFHLQDSQSLVKNEEIEYQKCSNELIEMQIGAKEGLAIILRELKICN